MRTYNRPADMVTLLELEHLVEPGPGLETDIRQELWDHWKADGPGVGLNARALVIYRILLFDLDGRADSYEEMILAVREQLGWSRRGIRKYLKQLVACGAVTETRSLLDNWSRRLKVTIVDVEA